MTAFLARFLWSLPFCWLLLTANALPSIAWGDDAQIPASSGYDERSLLTVIYDADSALAGNERELRRCGDCVFSGLNPRNDTLFAQFAEFLAAKTGVNAAEDVNYLYQKVGAEGEHLKFGITKNPATRYTQEELGGGQLRILTEGPRKDMLQLERNLHETLPIGPEEAQKFYIQKQIEKGLNPPPYNP